MKCEKCSDEFKRDDDDEETNVCPPCAKWIWGKDWETECSVCGMKPVVNATGMCGPCTWGETKTMNGEWETPYDDDEKIIAKDPSLREEVQ